MAFEPPDEFASEDELKSLLERWIVPGPSRVLDKRIETSFAREFSGAKGLSQPELLPLRREEVVSMKFCSKCQEEFADKFSFCPVDGTPLTAATAKVMPVANVIDDPSITVSKNDEPAATNWVAAQAEQPEITEPVYAASDVTAANNGSANHQEMLLRMYCDGNARPAVEAPVGDFFVNCFGQRREVISLPVIVEDEDATTIVPPGWTVSPGAAESLRLRRGGA